MVADVYCVSFLTCSVPINPILGPNLTAYLGVQSVIASVKLKHVPSLVCPKIRIASSDGASMNSSCIASS